MITRASPKSHWAWPGAWDSGTNISLVRRAALPDVVLDDGVLARKPVLVAQPLEDALGRVALLPGDLVVFFKDAVDDAGVGLQHGPSGRSLPPVARWD